MRDTTSTYVARLFIHGISLSPAAWNCRRDGRPTSAALTRYVAAFEASTRGGGVNAHLGAMTVQRATVCFNEAYWVMVAEYEAPKGDVPPMRFEVI
jgi:hypothetical protein